MTSHCAGFSDNQQSVQIKSNKKIRASQLWKLNRGFLFKSRFVQKKTLPFVCPWKWCFISMLRHLHGFYNFKCVFIFSQALHFFSHCKGWFLIFTIMVCRFFPIYIYIYCSVFIPWDKLESHWANMKPTKPLQNVMGNSNEPWRNVDLQSKDNNLK